VLGISARAVNGWVLMIADHYSRVVRWRHAASMPFHLMKSILGAAAP
jgi:hypothetical protein